MSIHKNPKGVTRRLVRDLLRRGWTGREIALRLGISIQAVHKHRKRIEAERAARAKAQRRRLHGKAS